MLIMAGARVRLRQDRFSARNPNQAVHGEQRKRACVIHNPGQSSRFQIVPHQAILPIFGSQSLLDQRPAAKTKLVQLRSKKQIDWRRRTFAKPLLKLLGAQKFSRIALTTSRATSRLKRSSAASLSSK